MTFKIRSGAICRSLCAFRDEGNSGKWNTFPSFAVDNEAFKVSMLRQYIKRDNENKFCQNNPCKYHWNRYWIKNIDLVLGRKITLYIVRNRYECNGIGKQS